MLSLFMSHDLKYPNGVRYDNTYLITILSNNKILTI